MRFALGETSEIHHDETHDQNAGTLSLHAFADLTHVSPVLFLFLLKECYIYGQCKGSRKFQALQYQVHQVLRNSPQPGPATFVAQCLLVLPVLGTYGGGFSHLIISAFCRFLKSEATANSRTDSQMAKELAARLFLDNIGAPAAYDEKILVKVVQAFDIKLLDIDGAIGQQKSEDGCEFVNAKEFIEHYIIRLIRSCSFMEAVSLLEHFSICFHHPSLLQQMLNNKEYSAAERWASFMGKATLCALVQEYAERNMLKNALVLIGKNNLRQDFPELYHRCKQSSLKRLAEKACWDVAEARAKGDKHLLEYLVYLAMELGYSEKVEELCDRYCLEAFVKSKGSNTLLETKVGMLQNKFLHLKDLAIEDVIWVGEFGDLETATCYLKGFRIIGIDCEWKPNYVKGHKPNKVSIMQIASDRKVFILDLIRLSKEAPGVLDKCLSQILQSPQILKLGYNYQADVSQLVRSYGKLRCFKHYDTLLDLQNVFKAESGGLSGLAKKILGVGLNKTRRNSDWEKRPLSQHQLEYAALDAAVLVHIFSHIQNSSGGHEKLKWKSHIVSHVDKRS